MKPKPITIRLDPRALSYFRTLARRTGLRYQTLINSYLLSCAARKLRPSTIWESAHPGEHSFARALMSTEAGIPSPPDD